MTTYLPLRVGTRQSPLAMAQTAIFLQRLAAAHPNLAEAAQTIPMVTSGDRLHDRVLADVGGKGLFTTELERALRDRTIDCAVHSLKDVDIHAERSQPDLVMDCFLPRSAPWDVLLSQQGWSLEMLPKGARVGTVSPRRTAQLLSVRPDLTLLPLRGNVNTRLSRLRAGDFDAIVLAQAGLERLHVDPSLYPTLEGPSFLPAPGQGIIAIQRHRDNKELGAYLAAINDAHSALCARAERSVLITLQGNCHTPIGALATLKPPPPHEASTTKTGILLSLEARLLSPNGHLFWHETTFGPSEEAESLGLGVGEALRQRCQAQSS